MRLGIMGGTFNPPHNGHLEAARYARHALDLEHVLFIPTNIPPHKVIPHGSASAAQRCEMVRLMLREEPWATVSTLEIDRGGASYTVDTLRVLREQNGHAAFFLIVGTDMLLTLETWREPESICRLAAFAVIAREEEDRAALAGQAAYLRELYGADIRLIDCPALPVSSTALRESGGFRQYVPLPVAQYIETNRLYQQLP